MMEIQNSLLGIAVLPKPASPDVEGTAFPSAAGAGKGLAPPGPEPPPAVESSAREGEVATKPNATSIEPDSPSAKSDKSAVDGGAKLPGENFAADIAVSAEMLAAVAADAFFAPAAALDAAKPSSASPSIADVAKTQPLNPAFVQGRPAEVYGAAADVAMPVVEGAPATAESADILGGASVDAEPAATAVSHATDPNLSHDVGGFESGAFGADPAKEPSVPTHRTPNAQPGQRPANVDGFEVPGAAIAGEDSTFAIDAAAAALENESASPVAPNASADLANRKGAVATPMPSQRLESGQAADMAKPSSVKASAQAKPLGGAADEDPQAIDAAPPVPSKTQIADFGPDGSEAAEVQQSQEAAPSSQGKPFEQSANDTYTDADLAPGAASKTTETDSSVDGATPTKSETKPIGKPSEPTHESAASVDQAVPSADVAVRATSSKPGVDLESSPADRSDTADKVLQQVADRIELLAATKPRAGVTVRLQPEEFGSITLVVRAHGNDVDAEVFASNDEVRKALDASRSLLGASLQARGITLQTLTVDAQAATFQAPSDQASRHAPTQQPATTPGHFVAADSNQAADLAMMRTFARKADGIDIWT